MATTALSGTLRITSGLIVVATMGYAGYVHRSPWVILLFGGVFTVLYIHGKLPQWRRAVSQQGWLAVLLGLPLTFAIQCVLAAMFYLIGFGLGALFTDAAVQGELTAFDYQTAGALLAIAVPIGFIVHWLEARAGEPVAAGGAGSLQAATFSGDDHRSGVHEDDDDAADDLNDALFDVLWDARSAEDDHPQETDLTDLAGKIVTHQDRAAAERFIEVELMRDQSPFLRRLGLRALRVMGDDAMSNRRDVRDRLVIDALSDDDGAVRLEAATLAGVLTSHQDSFRAPLEQLIENGGIDAHPRSQSGAVDPGPDAALNPEIVQQAREALATLSTR